MPNKEELFTEEMARSIFIFDSGKHQPYKRDGKNALKGSIPKVYQVFTKKGKVVSRNYGSILRFS